MLRHPSTAFGHVIRWQGRGKRARRASPAADLRVRRFLHAIEAGYSKRNPYHSATHAADVLQSVHALLHTGGLRVKYANSSNAVLACYLAAVSVCPPAAASGSRWLSPLCVDRSPQRGG